MNDKSYVNWVSMSDKALGEAIGKFIQHHRLNQNKSQDEVSRDAGISRSTLSLLERGGKVTLSTLIQVLRVLDVLYVMDAFKVSEEISPILYAKMKKQKRKQASGKRSKTNENDEVEW